MSEQRPFDPVSLIYILRFVFLVLQMHGIGQPAGDEADEQVTLALYFLSYHADTCKWTLPQILRIGDSDRPRSDSLAPTPSARRDYLHAYFFNAGLSPTLQDDQGLPA